jgi:hypothetical protein
MTGQRTDEQAAPSPELVGDSTVWTPQRGDPVNDSAAGRAGVVVAVPEDTGTKSYHLCPAGGGDQWPALRIHLVPCAEEADDGLILDEAAMPPGGFAPDTDGAP